jgi:hypothetical protein
MMQRPLFPIVPNGGFPGKVPLSDVNANSDAAGASKASPRWGYLNMTVLMVMAKNTMLINPVVR